MYKLYCLFLPVGTCLFYIDKINPRFFTNRFDVDYTRSYNQYYKEISTEQIVLFMMLIHCSELIPGKPVLIIGSHIINIFYK